jgi:hypothetical protein
MQETAFVFHNKSTVHAKEKPRLAWLLPGTQELHCKNTGCLIHISNFIVETTGQLKLTADQFEQSQSRPVKPESDNAATVSYPGSAGDKWWDMEQLCNQVSM